MRHRSRVLGGLAVLACTGMVVAGCSKSSSSSAAGGTATTGGGATPTCKTVAIGFFGALTGASANLGVNEDLGTKLAVAQFNKANPDCDVKVTDFDSQGSQDQAPQLALKAVQDKSIVALVGPPFSGESKTADPAFNEAGLPTITPSASNPKLSTNRWKVFHRAIGNDNTQGPSAAGYIQNTLKAKKVAVIDDASEYGKGIADIVRQKLGAADTVNDTVNVTPDAPLPDFSSTVNKVKAGNVDAVFWGGYYQAAGVLAKQLVDAGVKAPFIAPDGSNDPGFIQAAGTASEGAVLTAPAVPNDQIAGGTQFVTDYKAMFNKDVGLYSAEAFDSANFLLQAIKAGKLTRAAINDYLNSGASYTGLTKTMKFDSTGELVAGVVIWAFKVQGGKIVPLQDISIK